MKLYIITDLGFGDCGKGTTVDFLTRQEKKTLIVRYNGGPQAAHNVVTSTGQHHCFSQFGSGSLVPGTSTYLSAHMLVNPIQLLNEAEHLSTLGVDKPLSRMNVDENCLVITPFQQAANRIKEAIYGDKLSGSCGKGIWETQSDFEKFGDKVLFVRDLNNIPVALSKLLFIQKTKKLELSNLAKKSILKDKEIEYEVDLLDNPDAPGLCMQHYRKFMNSVNIVPNNFLQQALGDYPQIIFEGAQGVLLDVNYGFHPYKTWTDITPHHAEDILISANVSLADVHYLGIIRSYQTRHGPGPFVTEDNTLKLPELHNDDNRWQKSFRVGYFDAVATKYAIDVAGTMTSLSMTHLDYLNRMPHLFCDRYIYTGNDVELLQNYFTLDGNRIITGIKILPTDTPDLEKQRMSAILFDCKPNLVQFFDNFVDTAELVLNTKVSIVSNGPAEIDKKFAKQLV